jgi:hypothetical protein
VTGKKVEAVLATVHGRPFHCTVCAGETFDRRTVLLNTVLAELFGFAWANRAANCLVCRACGFVHWFLDSRATKLSRSGSRR